MNVGAGIGMGLLWAVVPAALLLALLWWIDRYEKEPAAYIGIALLSGTVALGLAVALEALFGLPIGLYPHVFVMQQNLNPYTPLVEEASKAALLLIVFLVVRQEVDDVLDGIIYGSVLGIGFAMIQNFAYFFVAYGQYGALLDVSWTTYVQVAIGGLNHAFYTALFGGALGYLRTARNPARLVWLPVVAVLAAYGTHLLHDYMPDLLQPLTATWPASSLLLLGVAWNAANWLGMIALAVIVVWVWGSEAQIVKDQLADEVTRGVVLPDERSVLSSSMRRFAREAEALFTGGFTRWRDLKSLHDLEVELAFHKWHYQRDDQIGLGRQSLSDDDYRERIRRLRGRLPPLEVR